MKVFCALLASVAGLASKDGMCMLQSHRFLQRTPAHLAVSDAHPTVLTQAVASSASPATATDSRSSGAPSAATSGQDAPKAKTGASGEEKKLAAPAGESAAAPKTFGGMPIPPPAPHALDWLEEIKRGHKEAVARQVALQADPGIGSVTTETWACFGLTLVGAIVGLIVWRLVCDEMELRPVQEVGRLAILDNAKCLLMVGIIGGHLMYWKDGGTNIDTVTWMYGGQYQANFVVKSFADVVMPMFSFISGLVSQGSATPKRLRRYVQYLVCPTLLWSIIGVGVVFNFLQEFNINKAKYAMEDLFAGNMPHQEGTWYLVALVLWRGAVFLLFAQMPKVYVFPLMIVASCVGGYYQALDGLFNLNEDGKPGDRGPCAAAFGLLPWFGLGYICPFQTILQMVPNPSTPVKWAWLLVFIAWMQVFFNGYNVFEVELPCPHGTYWSCAAHKVFEEAGWWETRLYWSRRTARVLVEGVPLFMGVFLIAPRTQSFMTNVGSATLYIYLLHPPVSHWWTMILTTVMGFFEYPMIENVLVHWVVAWGHIPGALVIASFIALPPFRMCFSWIIEPQWLDPLFSVSLRDEPVKAEKAAADNKEVAKTVAA